MTKRRNGRYTKRSESIDPYANLVADIIIDAIHIASGQSPATNDTQRAEEIYWLRGETCRRWAQTIGVDIEVALGHKDSLVKLER
jgi:hypothetical protein